MRIPKSKMPLLLSAIGFLLDELDIDIEENGGEDRYTEDAEEKRELVAQLHDKISQCQHGDGTALDIEVYYGN